MPYIPRHLRGQVHRMGPQNVGELAYALNYTIKEYLSTFGVTYSRLAEVLGALETVKHEVYRLQAAPYEEKKRKANGDV